MTINPIRNLFMTFYFLNNSLHQIYILPKNTENQIQHYPTRNTACPLRNELTGNELPYSTVYDLHNNRLNFVLSNENILPERDESATQENGDVGSRDIDPQFKTFPVNFRSKGFYRRTKYDSIGDIKAGKENLLVGELKSKERQNHFSWRKPATQSQVDIEENSNSEKNITPKREIVKPINYNETIINQTNIYILFSDSILDNYSKKNTQNYSNTLNHFAQNSKDTLNKLTNTIKEKVKNNTTINQMLGRNVSNVTCIPSVVCLRQNGSEMSAINNDTSEKLNVTMTLFGNILKTATDQYIKLKSTTTNIPTQKIVIPKEGTFQTTQANITTSKNDERFKTQTNNQTAEETQPTTRQLTEKITTEPGLKTNEKEHDKNTKTKAKCFTLNELAEEIHSLKNSQKTRTSSTEIIGNPTTSIDNSTRLLVQETTTQLQVKITNLADFENETLKVKSRKPKTTLKTESRKKSSTQKLKQNIFAPTDKYTSKEDRRQNRTVLVIKLISEKPTKVSENGRTSFLKN